MGLQFINQSDDNFVVPTAAFKESRINGYHMPLLPWENEGGRYIELHSEATEELKEKMRGTKETHF